MPKITVGIPIYNQKKSYFEECIQSVINQTYKNFEIIVLDDGSEPSVSIVLPDTKGIEIKLIRHKKNMGIGATRQAIVDNSSKETEFVCFLSSDDIWDEKFLEVMIKKAEKNPNKILYSDYYFINREGKIVNKTDFSYFKYEDFCIASWEAAVKNNMFVNFSTVFIPRGVFEKVQFDKNLRYAEDLDFLLRSMKHFKYFPVKQLLLKYRLEDNLTSRILDKIPEQNKKIRKKCREYWRENG